MERLTVNKSVSEMDMVELAFNCCFAKDRNATYRDFESEIDARDLVRKIGLTFGVFENDCEELTDNEALDEVMTDYLKYGYYDEKEGLLALFYRNLWAQANLYEKLKYYENLEEQGLLLKPKCKVRDTVYVFLPNDNHFSVAQINKIEVNPTIYGKMCYFIEPVSFRGHLYRYFEDDFGKTVFFTQAQAEEALKRMEGKWVIAMGIVDT